MHSNRYTLMYALGLAVVVGAALAVASAGLGPRQQRNIAQAKRSAILETVMEVRPETLERDYETYITELVFDVDGNMVSDVRGFDIDVERESKKDPADRNFPVYVYQDELRTHYIVPLQGTGLWGPISAYVALESDLDTVYSVVFEHEKETPGLGAEISGQSFEGQFKGKKLFADDGAFESIRVLKGTGNDTEERPHAVDGLTGATMTTNGVNRMLSEEIGLHIRILEAIGRST